MQGKEERRLPREHFTVILENIARLIDENQVFELNWTLPKAFEFLGERKRFGKIRIEKLWAFGSWARGALTCGDLDLIVEISILTGDAPPEGTLRGALTGAPYIRMQVDYAGQAIKCYSEAKLIWAPESRDWKSNIEKIIINPHYTRFERKSDAIPLRLEQIDVPEYRVEEVIDLERKGIISWFWRSLESITPDPQSWSETSKAFLADVSKCKRRNIVEIMPFVIQWFEENETNIVGFKGIERFKFTDTHYLWEINGGILLHVGRPCIPVEKINDLLLSMLVLVPHKSRRGPNGLWIIRRGQNHPLESSFREIGAFYLTRDSTPHLVYEYCDYWKNIVVGWLYTCKKSAEEAALAETEIGAEWSIRIDVGYFSGTALLNYISSVDGLEIDGPETRIAVKNFGANFNNVLGFAGADAEGIKRRLLKVINGAPDKH